MSVAQQKKERKVARLSLKTGLNYHHLSLNGLDESNFDSRWKFGYVFGAFVEMKASENLYFQPELLYSSMGGRVLRPGSGEDKIRLNYLAIPLMLKYKICDQFFFGTGVQISWVITAKNGTEDIYSDVKQNEFSLLGGFEYWTGKKVVLNARYIRGLGNLELYTNTKTFNEGVQLTIGLKL
ncbi:MAG: PorT family protein [Bacteroidia bacterium]|nr:PorT family protein [Bacteroidia bacterium]